MKLSTLKGFQEAWPEKKQIAFQNTHKTVDLKSGITVMEASNTSFDIRAEGYNQALSQTAEVEIVVDEEELATLAYDGIMKWNSIPMTNRTSPVKYVVAEHIKANSHKFLKLTKGA